MKNIKSLIPEFVKRLYHCVRAWVAAAQYGFPARGMIVVGVTGTKGKTSTANYIWSVLHAGGIHAGLISSANFRIGDIETPNPYHMTMPDPFLIQKKMREMRTAGVTAVAMEMTSEGMKQYRHIGIPVDIAIFTNLSPEHLGSHGGSFETYKKAKNVLFKKSLQHANKVLEGRTIPRVIIANADSEHASYYLQSPADQKITYGFDAGDVIANNPVSNALGTTFTVEGKTVRLSIPGIFNIYNALPAFIMGRVFGIPEEKVLAGLASLKVIPGRMELIDEGQEFLVVVDYAHEPASLGALLAAAESLRGEGGRTILLTGVIGGGRESRVPLVRLAAKKADYLIITNEDPYDEDPAMLVETLSKVAEEEGKKPDSNLFSILDRRAAIQKALSLAGPSDIVLISGKGAEMTMITKDGAVPWNERAIVRELVRNINK
jgi:UDP-N-acetylmuramoyl-L-alanyl-D-glutamate--2,6-diaminopimelate ligase